MGSDDVLHTTLRTAHDDLAAQLRTLQAGSWPPGSPGSSAPREGPRRGNQQADRFLAGASRHLHAVDAVVVSQARRALPDGKQAAAGHRVAARELEVALAHAKAHEYGSVYERRYRWAEVWQEVEDALTRERAAEEDLADRLADALPDEALADLAERVAQVESTAPSRPHPYLPHAGVLGAVTRRVARTTDAFWDTVEGRMLPVPVHAPRKRPGLVGQYFLGNPRLDDED